MRLSWNSHPSDYLAVFLTSICLCCGKRVLILNIDCLLFIMFLFQILWPGAATNVGLFNLLTVAFVAAIVPKQLLHLS